MSEERSGSPQCAGTLQAVASRRSRLGLPCEEVASEVGQHEVLAAVGEACIVGML